jgi:uncharacterized delta-60 repeat protein
MVRRALASAVVVCLGLVAAPSAPASPGDLDPSFGTGGVGDFPYNYATTIAAGPDGSVVAVKPGPSPSGVSEFGRTAPDGELDTSFGNGGKAQITVPGQGGGDLTRLAVAPDGKIVAAGVKSLLYPNENGLVVRLNADGSPDSSFGANGVETFDVGGREHVYDLALAGEGAVIVVGTILDPSGAPKTSFVGRLRPDGTPDPAFASSGFLTDVDHDPSTNESAQAVAVLPDGRIEVLVGLGPFGQLEHRVLMLEPDGTLDTSFAGDGMAELPLAASYSTSMVRTHSGATYVIAPRSVNPQSSQTIVRLEADGQQDLDFGDAGTLEITALSGTALVDGSDRLVVLTTTRTAANASDPYADADLELIGLNDDGSLDRTFGENGVALTDVTGAGATDYASAATVDGEGRIVVLDQFAPGPLPGASRLLRYLPGPGPDDLDADGLLDGSDACPRRYAPDAADGCPTWTVTGLDIAYARKIDDFVGALSFLPANACSEGAVVAMWRVRAGRDRFVGRSEPVTRGEPSGAGAVQYTWSVSALAPPGRYYARVVSRTIAGFGHCGTSTSPILRIRHRK